MAENINIQSFKVTTEKFFKMWLMILQPFLKLRNKEIDVVAKLLYHRYLISLEVKNKEMLDELLFSNKMKKKLISELNIPESAYNNILTSLRKKDIITNKSLNKQIIPVFNNITSNNFKLVYNFDIIENVK